MIETAAILVGGLGTRLRSVVADRPKPLAEVGGRPFVAELLDRLEAAGVRRTVLCCGYGAGYVQEALGHQHGGMALAYSLEPEPAGTGGALAWAAPMLVDDTSHTLVLNGDSLCDADLVRFAAFAMREPTTGTVAAVHVSDASRYGALAILGEAVVGFGEKRPDAGAAWINAGVYAIPRAWLSDLPQGRPCSVERDVFPRKLGAGLRAFRTDGRFLDIGTPESYAEAEAFVATAAGLRTAA